MNSREKIKESMRPVADALERAIDALEVIKDGRGWMMDRGANVTFTIEDMKDIAEEAFKDCLELLKWIK